MLSDGVSWDTESIVDSALSDETCAKIKLRKFGKFICLCNYKTPIQETELRIKLVEWSPPSVPVQPGSYYRSREYLSTH